MGFYMDGNKRARAIRFFFFTVINRENRNGIYSSNCCVLGKKEFLQRTSAKQGRHRYLSVTWAQRHLAQVAGIFADLRGQPRRRFVAGAQRPRRVAKRCQLVPAGLHRARAADAVALASPVHQLFHNLPQNDVDGGDLIRKAVNELEERVGWNPRTFPLVVSCRDG